MPTHVIPRHIPLLQRAGCLCLGVLFAAVCYAGFFGANDPALPSIGVLVASGLYLAVLVMLSQLFRRHQSRLEQQFPLWLTGTAILYFAGMILLAQPLRFVPAFDLSAVFDGAAAWGIRGELCALQSATTDGSTYFYYFPNNLGATALLALWFRLCTLLGLQDLFGCAVVLNALLLSATLVLTALTARRLAGVRCAAQATAAFLLYPPMWFGAAVFYTDFLSIVFPMLTLFLVLEGRRTCGKRRIAAYALAGIVLGLGCLVKMTVLLCMIAFLICLTMERRFKEAAAWAASGLLCVWLCAAGLNACVYPAQLDPQKANSMATPVWHWVMMSLYPQGNGGYRPEDYDFTRSFVDPDVRAKATRDEALARLKEMGPAGFGALALRKWQVCWGDGTLNLGEMLDDMPLTPGPLHELLLNQGSQHQTYRMLCDGMLLCWLLTATALCLRGAIRYQTPFWYAPPLCVAGLALFLLLWETNARYITNYIPLLILCAAQWMCPKSDA